jgi:hypothetical protein
MIHHSLFVLLTFVNASHDNLYSIKNLKIDMSKYINYPNEAIKTIAIELKNKI